MNTTLINAAARMAGQWWAARLREAHAEKRAAFAGEVAKLVKMALNGEVQWEIWGEQKPGLGKPVDGIYMECDYDPNGLLLDAVRAVIDPECRGMMFSADGILPRKHELRIDMEKAMLKPKEGYGNWTAHIPIVTQPGDDA